MLVARYLHGRRRCRAKGLDMELKPSMRRWTPCQADTRTGMIVEFANGDDPFTAQKRRSGLVFGGTVLLTQVSGTTKYRQFKRPRALPKAWASAAALSDSIGVR